MNHIKTIINYIIIFTGIVALLTVLLFLVAKIPRKYIEENIRESLPYFNKYRFQIEDLTKRRDYTIINPYADSMILNIIYALDTDNSAKSVMEARYYSEHGDDDYENKDLNKMVEKGLEPNQEYMRYWHGSIIIIKPLLMFFNLEQMQKFNGAILIIMEITLIVILLKKKQYQVCIAYILGLLATSFWIVPKSLEYTWVYMLMNIISIIAIILKDKPSKLNKLFFISGILTCYFDFLTAETLSILVPIIMVIAIRFKENKEFCLKENMIFIIKSIFTWGIAYSFMWLAKWCIASVILQKSALPYVIGKASRRINGALYEKTKFDMYIGAILRNVLTLFPINIVKKATKLIYPFLIYLIIQVLMIDYKNKNKRNLLILLLIIGILPYIRYLILANHSYLHCFFTFRAQFTTVMACALIFLLTTSKEKLFSQINSKKRRKG